MSAGIYIGAVVVWWTFAVTVFAFLTYERDGEKGERIAMAVFWPLFVVLALPVMLWRIPFRTAKAIRVDLRNRKLLRKFDAWLKEQEGGE